MASALRPAVFLDRDGTLIEDVGYVAEPAQARWLPGVFRALELLSGRFPLFVVTNQPGVSRGALTLEQVDGVHRHLVGELAARGVEIREVYACPHDRSLGCRCVKPNPYFLERAARDHGIDLARSFVVGDHPYDMELARGVGARGVYLLSGHGEKHRGELTGAESAVVPGLLDAARWILARTHPGPSGLGEVAAAAELLRRGGTVAFPTETVYGLGAHALDPAAVARVFEIKGRPRFDPLIVHLAGPEALGAVAAEVPPAARELARRFWPGPLTLVLPKRPEVPDLTTSGLPTVAVRVPDHPLALDLLSRAGVPVAAPSANPFGRVSPTRAEHVFEQLAGAVDAILDGGPCRVGVESTIVSLAEGRPVLLRPGGLPAEELEAVVGPLERPGNPAGRPLAPGSLVSHYAPRVPLVLASPGAPPPPGRIGLLALGEPESRAGYAAVEVLSPSRDLREAAAHLFAALRRLDARGLDLIVAEPVPEEGLGRAILDRLRRAAASREGG
ncbi:MAG: L-threonylcarbamoyladenylate synthase [Thermodesulfobacteriota bacterium]